MQHYTKQVITKLRLKFCYSYSSNQISIHNANVAPIHLRQKVIEANRPTYDFI